MAHFTFSKLWRERWWDVCCAVERCRQWISQVSLVNLLTVSIIFHCIGSKQLTDFFTMQWLYLVFYSIHSLLTDISIDHSDIGMHIINIFVSGVPWYANLDSYDLNDALNKKISLNCHIINICLQGNGNMRLLSAPYFSQTVITRCPWMDLCHSGIQYWTCQDVRWGMGHCEIVIFCF